MATILNQNTHINAILMLITNIYHSTTDILQFYYSYIYFFFMVDIGYSALTFLWV